jgi:hypothetical protein
MAKAPVHKASRHHARHILLKKITYSCSIDLLAVWCDYKLIPLESVLLFLVLRKKQMERSLRGYFVVFAVFPIDLFCWGSLVGKLMHYRPREAFFEEHSLS